MSIAEHVDLAVEQLRAANHATHDGPLDGPSAAVVVGNLRELVARLPQLLDHLRRSARRANFAAHYDDRPGVPVVRTFGFAMDHLDDSRQLADALHDQLAAAHNDLGHIGRHLVED